MKKLFITGIGGMLGANIAFLLKDKYLIEGCDKIDLDFKGIKTYCYDILNYDYLFNNLSEVKPDVVIHTAALVSVDGCETNPAFAKKLNTELTGKIADYCKQNNVKLIYISTDAVFDGFVDKLNKESDVTNPINIYGKTKLDGEKFLDLTKDLIVRTNIYGFNIQNKNSFGEWLYCALNGNETLRMFNDIYFSPILVNELVEKLDFCIEKGVCGLYNVCGTGSINKYDFGIYFKNCFHIESGDIISVSVDNAELKAKRTKFMGLDNSKFRNDFSVDIMTPRQSIDEFYRLFKCGYKEQLLDWGKLK